MELPFIYNKKLLVDGFNATIRRKNDSEGWEGISRVQERPEEGSRVWKNKLIYFTTDEDFNIEDSSLLVDRTTRVRHLSYTEGCEDPRLLDSNKALTVTLDTNNRWKPEISLIEFDSKSSIISSIKPLEVDGISVNSIQKNWIPLKVSGSGTMSPKLILLHQSFPFRIISVDMKTGKGSIIKEYTTPLDSTGIVAHNGAALQLVDGKWLVTVRIKNGYKYKHSLWLLLDEEYNLIKYSEPFVFRKLCSDGSPVSYEMCMSMQHDKHESDNVIVCSVGLSDTHSEIFKYKINVILDLLVNSVL